MTEFNKITNVTARMNVGDLISVNMSPRGYNPSLTLNFRDNESLEISVTGDTDNATEEFKLLIEMILATALDADWTQRYNGGHAYRNPSSNKPRVTLEQIAEWRQFHEEQAEVLESESL